MTKEEMLTKEIMWEEMEEIDWTAYQQGYKTCKKYDNNMQAAKKNPYKPKTISWYSWNCGWNSYWPFKKKE